LLFHVEQPSLQVDPVDLKQIAIIFSSLKVSHILRTRRLIATVPRGTSGYRRSFAGCFQIMMS
jgi:hypothetical protein